MSIAVEISLIRVSYFSKCTLLLLQQQLAACLLTCKLSCLRAANTHTVLAIGADYVSNCIPVELIVCPCMSSHEQLAEHVLCPLVV
jgi:hypothetical protein